MPCRGDAESGAVSLVRPVLFVSGDGGVENSIPTPFSSRFYLPLYPQHLGPARSKKMCFRGELNARPPPPWYRARKAISQKITLRETTY